MWIIAHFVLSEFENLPENICPVTWSYNFCPAAADTPFHTLILLLHTCLVVAFLYRCIKHKHCTETCLDNSCYLIPVLPVTTVLPCTFVVSIWVLWSNMANAPLASKYHLALTIKHNSAQRRGWVRRWFAQICGILAKRAGKTSKWIFS